MTMDLQEQNKQRIKDLEGVQMSVSGDTFIGNSEINEDFNVHYTEFTTDTDTEWKDRMVGLRKELDNRLSKW